MKFRKKYKFKGYQDKKPKLTYLIISFCIGVFLLEMFLGFNYGEKAIVAIFNYFGFSLNALFEGNYFVFLTSIFLHASAEHLILNMFALYFFGRVIELELGWKRFLLIFFATGILGDLALLLTTFLGFYSAAVPTIGASAAIFGLMGVAMLIKPLEFVFYPYLIPVPLALVAILYTLYNIGALLLSLIVGQATEIAYVAHIGGLIGGVLFGLKQEKSRKGLIIILIFILLLMLIPIIWNFLLFLEKVNYMTIFSEVLR